MHGTRRTTSPRFIATREQGAPAVMTAAIVLSACCFAAQAPGAAAGGRLAIQLSTVEISAAESEPVMGMRGTPPTGPRSNLASRLLAASPRLTRSTVGSDALG